MIENRNWYTVKEFAKITGLSPATIYKYGKQGTLKIMNVIGGKKGVPKSEHERYLDNGMADTIQQ